MTTTPDPFGELIRRERGTRTNVDLARDMGGVVTGARVHQLATVRIKSFPDPRTINALAAGLGVPAGAIILAAAETLGVNTRGSVDDDVILVGAGRLPESSKELLRSMAAEMLELHHMSAHEELAS